MSIKDFSAEELVAELEKRKHSTDLVETMPKYLETPDFSQVSELVKIIFLK
jgi:hypothetical protein